jgi:lipopolysaccharide export system protein LptA
MKPIALLMLAAASCLPIFGGVIIPTVQAQTKVQPQTPPAAQNSAATPAQPAKRADPFGNFGGGNSKDPIRIDANKLEVFDKEQKAIYSGDVIAVRGNTTTRSTVMTIFYDGKKNDDKKADAQKKPPAASNASAGAAPAQDGALKRIEFKGPVSVVNGTQTATANEMVYDAIGKKVILKGNAVVTDGPNVQRGELMTYDTEASFAVITNPTPGGRVQGVFTPGSQDTPQTKKQDRKNTPATN